MLVEGISARCSGLRRQLAGNSCETLFWLIDFLPSFVGSPFWLLHLYFTFHAYIVGTIMYNKYFAKDVADYVNSFLNISILLLICTTTWWSLCKRSSVQEVLKMVKENDDLVKETEKYPEEHKNKLRYIKMLVLATFLFHFVNGVLIFCLSRVLDVNDMIVSSCTGLDPLSGNGNMVLCKVLLMLQELSAIVVFSTYDATLIFLITHTTAMSVLLQLDIASIRDISENSNLTGDATISNRLKQSIYRHAKILQTVKMLQHIYCATIGVDFLNYAMSLLVFFVLPLEICIKFSPLVSHNLIVFFLYCLLGQRLTTAAEGVEMAIYDCGWEDFSREDRVTVLFMLKRSQEPVILYAAKVMPICIYTFASAMQMIYKFVTVFKV